MSKQLKMSDDLSKVFIERNSHKNLGAVFDNGNCPEHTHFHVIEQMAMKCHLLYHMEMGMFRTIAM
jgi:hypothetical protein